MTSTCAQNDAKQSLQDLIFIGKTKLKSRFLIWHLGGLFRDFWFLLAPSLSYFGPSWWPRGCPEPSFGAILALSWSSSVALVRRLGRLMWLLELSWDLPMPLLAPTCTLTSQLGVNIGLNLPPKLIFPSIAVLPNLDFCITLQGFSGFFYISMNRFKYAAQAPT